MATGARAELPLEAVVLAAGAGSRFGGGKLLAPWGAGVLLDGAVAAAFVAPVRHVWLVTGADAERVAEAGRACAARLGQSDRLRVLLAADHQEGMGASLRTGVAALPADAGGVFVFLGDMPRIPPALPPRLAQALAGGAAAAAAAHGGRRGHPVLFGAELLPVLAASAGDEGARRALQGLGERLTLVETDDDGVLFDVDRPEDLPG